MFNSRLYKAELAASLILLASVGLIASDDKKKTPDAKPAATKAKPSASSPAAHGSTAGGTHTADGPTHNGPSANSASQPSTHSGPSANGSSQPSTHSGPSANGSSQPGSHGAPSANGPSQPGYHGGSSANGGFQPGSHNGPSGNGGFQPGAHNGTSANGAPRPDMHHVPGIGGRPAPVGVHVQTLRGGSAIQRRADGRLSDVHDARRGMDIHHGLNGGQRVVVVRADHSRIFVERGRPGYIQRPYSFRGHDFARRSYYYHGHMYESYYRGYRYRGIDVHIYAPVRYYPVGFYGWAYHPWGAPVRYTWGFGGAPWVGYYGFYFRPYPVYPSASLWLTDYMISNDLAAAYNAGRESATLEASEQASGDAPVLTPEVKQMIADEVRAEIALENSESQQNSRNQDIDPASSSIARTLADGHPHVFVVGSALDVVDDTGAECALSEGDALQMLTPPPPDATTVSLVVLSSKGRRECAKSGTVTVALADLQEMQNHMRETIDRGMAELREKQGQGGLPTAPASATAEPVPTAFAEVAPPPDPNDAKEIEQQMKVADQSEQEVAAEANQAQ